MESSFVVLSAVFPAEAWRLFDHHTRPESTAKRATAMVRPLGFTDYLLFHQVAMPNPTTPKGKMTTLNQNTRFDFCALMLMGRSSGALGRMEIKSSSAVNQLTIFSRRSRLPLKRMKPLPTHIELPTTTKRPCVLPLYVPAAARVSGPFLSVLGSMRMLPELRLPVA